MSTRPTTPPPAPWVTVATGRPPAGMIKAEADILTTWLTRNWEQYDSVAYNVRVGRGTIADPSAPDYANQAAVANSQRRIDALLMTGSLPTIVEVKVRGSLWAIGQLYGYRVLWMRDNPQGRIPSIIMLCGSIDDDTLYVCNSLGVTVKVVVP